MELPDANFKVTRVDGTEEVKEVKWNQYPSCPNCGKNLSMSGKCHICGYGFDNVNKPEHYRKGNIESITYIEDFLSDEEYVGFLRGNISKYLHRYRFKGKPLEDLRKAQWYLERLIEREEK